MKNPQEPSDEDRIITALYDSYMKTVLRNRSRTLQRRYYRRAGHESVAENPVKYLPLIADHNHGSENGNVIEIQGYRCVVGTDSMYEALISLPPKLLIVVVMWYWYAYKTQEISDYFGVSSRTILNWHNKAIALLRDSLGNGEAGANDAT